LILFPSIRAPKGTGNFFTKKVAYPSHVTDPLPQGERGKMWRLSMMERKKRVSPPLTGGD